MWLDSSYIKFHNKEIETNLGTFEPLDPAIPEARQFSDTCCLIQLSRTFCYLQPQDLYFFIHSSLPTYCSLISSNSFSVNRSYSSRSDIKPWNRMQKHFLLKAKTIGSSRGKVSPFSPCLQTCGCCQHEDRTSNFWSANNRALLMSKGLILTHSLELIRLIRIWLKSCRVETEGPWIHLPRYLHNFLLIY